MDLKGKRIAITGADGFIGSHLTEAITAHGAGHVKALNYYNSFNDWGWLEHVDCKDDIEVVSGDVRDPNFCRDFLKDTDVVFHLAALIAIPYSYVAPDSYIDTNVRGTLNICQAAKDLGLERVLSTSTSEVYGTAQSVPINEEHALQPQSPYSASKIGADAIAMSFYNSFETPVTLVRPFNTFGPRQSARAIIPTIITQVVAGIDPIKLGDLTPTRDFTYVKDTAKGFISVAEDDRTIGETVNISCNYEISIGDLVEMIKTEMNSNVTIESEAQRIRPENSEVFRLWGDNSKLQNLTGFEPAFTLEEGIRETIAWFSDQENLKKYKPGIYNV